MIRFDPISMMWEGYFKNQFIGLFGSIEDARAYLKKLLPNIRNTNDTKIT